VSAAGTDRHGRRAMRVLGQHVHSRALSCWPLGWLVCRLQQHGGAAARTAPPPGSAAWSACAAAPRSPSPAVRAPHSSSSSSSSPAGSDKAFQGARCSTKVPGTPH
jgi:hypothetical protein